MTDPVMWQWESNYEDNIGSAFSVVSSTLREIVLSMINFVI